MYQRIPTIQVRDIAKLFKYRKRSVAIRVADSVTLTDVNWSGGTKSEYAAYDLSTGATSHAVLDRNPPWANKAEGATVNIPENVIIVETGYFCGKPATMYLHVRPDNMPRLLQSA